MSEVLDDLERIKAIDRSGMIDLQLRWPSMCEDAIARARELELPRRLAASGLEIRYGEPASVLVCGMGGSAIGGNLLQDWLSDQPLLIAVWRDYGLPAWANPETLVFVISYSGNTEETIDALLEAVRRGCMLVGVSSGGLLSKYCRSLGIPLLSIPAGLPPRLALPYLFFPLPVVLGKLGLKVDENELEATISLLREIAPELAPEVPLVRNVAKRLALELLDTIPVIYGFRHYSSIALRFKTQLNENSKVPAKCELLPELDHNEIVGWEGPAELTRKFSVVFLRAEDEDRVIRARIELTKRILSGRVAKVLELEARGETRLSRMLSILYTGDFVSLYLAILRGVDPAPVRPISTLKRALERELGPLERFDRELSRIAGG